VNETIQVRLGAQGYPIHIATEAAGWAEPLASLIGNRKTVVLTTPRVTRLCLPLLKKELDSRKISYRSLQIPADGERFKNLSTVAKAYKGLVRLGVDRSALVLLLGGGVLGDLGGFVAATFLRGLSFIHLPTTLVAQVDSAIGGKLGIDLPEGKNLVGLFQQPKAVLSYIPFLKTLPEREIRGGLGEVIKYGVIRDPSLFHLVQTETERIFARDPEILREVVARSAAIKAKVVEEDEKETSGVRMILNFGHTFGHALERLRKYRGIHHGEAVAVGMALAATISHRLGFCSEAAAGEVRRGIERIGLPADLPRFPRKEWLRSIEVDKKSREGMIHFVFLKEIGQVVVQPIAPEDLVKHL
jgi:3-dehydroquinate synthase